MGHSIGTLNEKPLHAELKRWYAESGDRFEVRVDGFVVDIVRGDLLIEIQTAGFSSIRHKLRALTEKHPVRLVHPIACERWIVKLPDSRRARPARRKSPKRSALEDVFVELVSIPDLMRRPNFALEILLIREEEMRRLRRTRRRRHPRWRTEGRRLLDVIERHRFEEPADLGALIPDRVCEPFGTRDLAAATGRPRWHAQKMAYCLREMGVLAAVGKRGNAIQYARPLDARTD